MKLQFIDLIDAKGRASHLAVNETDGPEFLRVGGVLEHGAMIRPRTATDAMHLIEWTRKHFGFADPAADLAALRDALRGCVEWMEGQMDEAQKMDHMLDGHDEDQCCLCAARAVLARMQGKEAE